MSEDPLGHMREMMREMIDSEVIELRDKTWKTYEQLPEGADYMVHLAQMTVIDQELKRRKMTITLNGEEITTFRTFDQWKERQAVLKLSKNVVCVDSQGDACVVDRDFEYARDNGLFPVRAYRLRRTSEV